MDYVFWNALPIFLHHTTFSLECLLHVVLQSDIVTNGKLGNLDFYYQGNEHMFCIHILSLNFQSHADIHYIKLYIYIKCKFTFSLVPNGGPVCDMLSPKFECFSE